MDISWQKPPLLFQFILIPLHLRVSGRASVSVGRHVMKCTERRPSDMTCCLCSTSAPLPTILKGVLWCIKMTDPLKTLYHPLLIWFASESWEDTHIPGYQYQETS